MAGDEDERFKIKAESGAAPGPVNQEPSTIEPVSSHGEAQPLNEASAADNETMQSASDTGPPASAPDAAVRPSALVTKKTRARSSAPAVVGGIILGALIGAGGALALYYYLGAAQTADVQARVADLAARTDAIDRKSEALAAGLATLGSRVAAAESVAGKSAAATTSAIDELQKTIAARPAAAVSNSETEPSTSPVDLGPIKSRTDALEQRLASLAAAVVASQAEIRAQQNREKAAAAEQSSLVQSAEQSTAQSTAIVADSARQKVERGVPFPSEVVALENLGVDPAKLAPLRAVAKTGVSSVGKLAEQFEANSAAILAGDPARQDVGLLDRLIRDAANLVRVRRVGNANGADVESLVTRIQNALGRLDVEAAYVLWTELPSPAQVKSAAWGEAAKARLAALNAAAIIESDAVAALGKLKS
jgi:hypothetical protein